MKKYNTAIIGNGLTIRTAGCQHRFTDNQGLCWGCGIVMNPDWWAAYLASKEKA